MPVSADTLTHVETQTGRRCGTFSEQTAVFFDRAQTGICKCYTPRQTEETQLDYFSISVAAPQGILSVWGPL